MSAAALPAQPASPLRVLSVNPNGLRNVADRCSLFRTFLQGRYHVLAVQELHAASCEEVESWMRDGAGPGMPMRGQWFANPHSSRSCGVLTFVAEGAPVVALRSPPPPDGGRLLDTVLSYAGMELSLVNCYAPCEAATRPAFFRDTLGAAIPAAAVRPCLVVGDFNCVGTPLDVVGVGAVSQHRYAGFEQLAGVLDSRGLVDVWRELHPGQRGFTHTATSRASAARLDRAYAPAQLMPWVVRCEVVHGLPGDHLGQALTLAPPTAIPAGPGRFRLPLHLLSDTAFCDAMTQRIEQACERYPLEAGARNARQRWEAVKADCTLSSIALVKGARASAQRDRRQLTAAVERAFGLCCRQPEVAGHRDAFAVAQRALQDFEVAQAALHSQAGEVLTHCFGERNTKWFHRQGRRVLPHPPVHAVLDPAPVPEGVARAVADMATAAGRQQALRYAEAFFSGDSLTGLFRPVPTDPTAQQELLDAIDMFLSPAAAASTLGPSGDGCLHNEEVVAMFPALPRGVSPGLDGLPYEFYVHFWPQLGPLFLAMANEALEASLAAGGGDLLAVLPPSMLVGLIVLLLKPGAADARDLACRRPIALLNTDYRILARVLVSRLAGPLASVLDVTQTAFVPGRWVGDNVLCHLEEIAELQESDLPGCIVFLDWEKAYDRVDRGWLLAVLERMGLPSQAVSWVRLMLAGTTARVSLSGHYSAAFPVLSGVQQGSPLSCLLFNATVQPLAAAVRRLQRQGAMRPISLHGMLAPVCQQHADDTSLHGAGPQDIAAALQGPVELHRQASGARLNLAKCKGLMFGDQRSVNPDTRVCSVCQVTFPPPQEPIRHLGIYMGADAEVAATKTFQRVLGSIRTAATHWRQIQLTYIGRAHVAKQVLAAAAVHHATFVSPPRRLLRSITGVLSAFVADATLADGEGGGGISHPARHVAALPWEDGGVSLVDFELQMQSLQAGVAARLLHPARHPWKELLRRRLLRAVPSLGAAVCVSALQATTQRIGLDARTVGYLSALQRTLPHRVTAPAGLSPDHVRSERLFHNRQIRQGGQPLRPADWAGVVAAGILTVGQLGAALHSGQPPAGAPRILGCLPPAWQQLASHPASTEWQVSSSADGAEVVLHSPGDAAAQHYAVLPDGRLDPLAALPAAADAAAWQPCSVLSCLLQPSKPGRGEALFLAGRWADITVDPVVWGHGSVPLCSFTVKAATQRCIQLRAARLAPRWFAIGAGCRPALWSLPSDEAGPAAAATGLQAVELRWASSYDRRRLAEEQPRTRRAAEFEVDLLPCQRPGKRTRLSVHARLAARQQQQAAPVAEQAAGHGAGQPPQQGPSYPLQDDVLDAAATTPRDAERQAQRAFWERLRRADLPRDQYGLAYRIAHGSLYVGGFLCHISMLPPAAACCLHPTCDQLETLSHAFVTCPAVASAATWLCDLFAAVSGRPPPPATPQVLLADEPSVWQPHSSSLQFLWTNLRLAYLASVWRLRCERSLTHRPFDARAVTLAVVRVLRSAILRDWTRATRDLTRLDASYCEWFRGQDPSLSMEEFGSRWSFGGVLCSVQHALGGARQLQLRISQTTPVPVPPAPAGSA